MVTKHSVLGACGSLKYASDLDSEHNIIWEFGLIQFAHYKILWTKFGDKDNFIPK